MEQGQPNYNQSSDEIDLGQLFQLIRRSFNKLGNFILRVFIYLRRNALKIVGLALLGVAISFGLAQIITKKLKTDIIVRPNFESKNYLYDAVDEVAANIDGRNEAFFSDLDIKIEDLKGFKIEVDVIEDEEIKTDESVLNEMKYLEVLQNFKDESFVIDILRSELSEKSVTDHKITFTYKDPIIGPAIVEKVMNYLNTNMYFDELKTVYTANANSRIEKNTQLIQQIDQLVDTYSKVLMRENKPTESTLVMEGDKVLNVPLLLNLKNELTREIEEKKIEIAQQKGVLSIINFGKTQQVKKSFFNQTYFLIPTILIGGFFLLSFFQYLDRKSKEIQ